MDDFTSRLRRVLRGYLWLRVWGFGRLWDLRLRRFRGEGSLTLKCQGFGGLGFGLQGLGFGLQGLGFGLQGLGVSSLEHLQDWTGLGCSRTSSVEAFGAGCGELRCRSGDCLLGS